MGKWHRYAAGGGVGGLDSTDTWNAQVGQEDPFIASIHAKNRLMNSGLTGRKQDAAMSRAGLMPGQPSWSPMNAGLSAVAPVAAPAAPMAPAPPTIPEVAKRKPMPAVPSIAGTNALYQSAYPMTENRLPGQSGGLDLGGLQLARGGSVQNFLGGGPVRGGPPGIDTVPAKLPEGGYVLPAGTVEALGGAAAIYEMIGRAAPDAGGSRAVPAKVSNGEIVLTPAEVGVMGGKAKLDALVMETNGQAPENSDMIQVPAHTRRRPGMAKGGLVKDSAPYPANDQEVFNARVRERAQAGLDVGRPARSAPDPNPPTTFYNNDPRFTRDVSLAERVKNAFMATPTNTDMAMRRAAGEPSEHYAESRNYRENGGQWPMKKAATKLERAAEAVGSGTRKVFTDPVAAIPAALTGGLTSVALTGGAYDAATNALDQAYRYGEVKNYGDIAKAGFAGGVGAFGGELVGKGISRAAGGLGGAGDVPELLGRGYIAPLVGEGMQTMVGAGIDAVAAEASKRGYGRGGSVDFRQNYNTQLSPEQETAYQAWLPGEVAKRGQKPENAQDDYDMRGFYANRDKFPESGNGHWPDNYKKPNHDTFSDNSIYHGAPNPDGGTWQGGHWTEKPEGKWDYAPSESMLKTTHPKERLQNYIQQNEKGTTLVLPPGYGRGGQVQGIGTRYEQETAAYNAGRTPPPERPAVEAVNAPPAPRKPPMPPPTRPVAPGMGGIDVTKIPKEYAQGGWVTRADGTRVPLDDYNQETRQRAVYGQAGPNVPQVSDVEIANRQAPNTTNAAAAAGGLSNIPRQIPPRQVPASTPMMIAPGTPVAPASRRTPDLSRYGAGNAPPEVQVNADAALYSPADLERLGRPRKSLADLASQPSQQTPQPQAPARPLVEQAAGQPNPPMPRGGTTLQNPQQQAAAAAPAAGYSPADLERLGRSPAGPAAPAAGYSPADLERLGKTPPEYDPAADRPDITSGYSPADMERLGASPSGYSWDGVKRTMPASPAPAAPTASSDPSMPQPSLATRFGSGLKTALDAIRTIGDLTPVGIAKRVVPRAVEDVGLGFMGKQRGADATWPAQDPAVVAARATPPAKKPVDTRTASVTGGGSTSAPKSKTARPEVTSKGAPQRMEVNQPVTAADLGARYNGQARAFMGSLKPGMNELPGGIYATQGDSETGPIFSNRPEMATPVGFDRIRADGKLGGSPFGTLEGTRAQGQVDAYRTWMAGGEPDPTMTSGIRGPEARGLAVPIVSRGTLPDRSADFIGIPRQGPQPPPDYRAYGMGLTAQNNAANQQLALSKHELDIQNARVAIAKDLDAQKAAGVKEDLGAMASLFDPELRATGAALIQRMPATMPRGEKFLKAVELASILGSPEALVEKAKAAGNVTPEQIQNWIDMQYKEKLSLVKTPAPAAR